MLNAKVMAEGQITLPKYIREMLGVRPGDRVTFIAQDKQVLMVNSAVYAVNRLQDALKGQFEKAGLKDDDAITALVKEVRSEVERL